MAEADGVSISTKLPRAPMTRTTPKRCSVVGGNASMVRGVGGCLTGCADFDVAAAVEFGFGAGRVQDADRKAVRISLGQSHRTTVDGSTNIRA